MTTTYSSNVFDLNYSLSSSSSSSFITCIDRLKALQDLIIELSCPNFGLKYLGLNSFEGIIAMEMKLLKLLVLKA